MDTLAELLDAVEQLVARYNADTATPEEREAVEAGFCLVTPSTRSLVGLRGREMASSAVNVYRTR